MCTQWMPYSRMHTCYMRTLNCFLFWTLYYKTNSCKQSWLPFFFSLLVWQYDLKEKKSQICNISSSPIPFPCKHFYEGWCVDSCKTIGIWLCPSSYLQPLVPYFGKLDFNFDRLWRENLRGVLFEYFRGQPNAIEIVNQLKDAYHSFVMGIANSSAIKTVDDR